MPIYSALFIYFCLLVLWFCGCLVPSFSWSFGGPLVLFLVRWSIGINLRGLQKSKHLRIWRDFCKTTKLPGCLPVALVLVSLSGCPSLMGKWEGDPSHLDCMPSPKSFLILSCKTVSFHCPLVDDRGHLCCVQHFYPFIFFCRDPFVTRSAAIVLSLVSLLTGNPYDPF